MGNRVKDAAAGRRLRAKTPRERGDVVELSTEVIPHKMRQLKMLSLVTGKPIKVLVPEAIDLLLKDYEARGAGPFPSVPERRDP